MSRATPPEDAAGAVEFEERHTRALREYAAAEGRRDAGHPMPGRFIDGELQALYELTAAGL